MQGLFNNIEFERNTVCPVIFQLMSVQVGRVMFQLFFGEYYDYFEVVLYVILQLNLLNCCTASFYYSFHNIKELSLGLFHGHSRKYMNAFQVY